MSDPVRAAVWAWLHEDGNEAMKDRAPLLGCVELWNEALAAGYRQGREEAEVHIRELLTAWQPGEDWETVVAARAFVQREREGSQPSPCSGLLVLTRDGDEYCPDCGGPPHAVGPPSEEAGDG